MASSVFLDPGANTTVTNIIISGVGYFADGTVALPSRTYTLDTDLGSYRIGANNEGFTAGGALIFDYNASRVNFTQPAYFPQGTQSAPSIARAANPATGFWFGTIGGIFSDNGHIIWYAADNNAQGLWVGSTYPVTWGTGDPGTGSPDIAVGRLASGQLSIFKDSTHGVALDVATDGTAKLLSRAGADTAILSANQFQTTLALIATGGGGGNPALVVASTGGTNQPTTAAQNGWMKAKDSTGATIWIPVWK